MNKISQYIKERAKWKKFGKPLRSDSERHELFNICKQCQQYQPLSEEAGKCGVCGCNINKDGTFLNKIAWATTRCPLENPKWIESDISYQEEVQFTKEELKIAEIELEAEHKITQNNSGCGCK